MMLTVATFLYVVFVTFVTITTLFNLVWKPVFALRAGRGFHFKMHWILYYGALWGLVVTFPMLYGAFFG